MADESLDITLTNNNNLNGALGLTNTNTNTNNTTTNTTSSETIEIKPISQTSNETSSQTMDLKPVKVDSNSVQQVVYDPIRTDASSTFDLKPLAIDVCMRSGPASLPPTHICEPYHHRIGLTFLGIEVFGLAWSGESQTIVDDRGRSHPVVAWGGVTPAPPPVHVGLPTAHHGPKHHEHHGGLEIHPKHEHSGLRIRLGD